MNFENIDIKDIECFGFHSPKKDCWLTILKKAKEYSNIPNTQTFQKDLKNNIEASYYRLCGISFVDLDTDLEYYASFVNGWKKWDLEIEGGKAEVDVEDKKKLFGNDEIKKIIARAAKYIEDAKAAYDTSVKQQVESGELLDIDETKLEGVIKYANDAALMTAFKKIAVSDKKFS